jgi:hypothetical protein
VEDVVAFQNVPSQRRRDIQQALVSTMSELFSFFLQIFDAYSTGDASLVSIPWGHIWLLSGDIDVVVSKPRISIFVLLRKTKKLF